MTSDQRIVLRTGCEPWFCLLPGVVAMMLPGAMAILVDAGKANQAPPMIVQLSTGDAGWLTGSGKRGDRLVPLLP